MIRIYKKENQLETNWKNGQGKTRQIAIFPEYATLADNNFLWRLSSATLLADNDFSEFAGFDRILLLLDGAINLNDHHIEALVPFSFQGEEKIRCTLLSPAPLTDVGLIFKRDRYKVQANFQSTTKKLLLNPMALHLLYAVNEFRAENELIRPGDVMEIQHESALSIESYNEALLIHFELL